MEYRQLGNTDIRLSAITLGTWAIGGLFWGGADDKESIAAIQQSIDEGITTIDTAPAYGLGLSEELIGRAIRGRRDKVQILTKFGIRWDTKEGTYFFSIKAPDGSTVSGNRFAGRQSVIRECEDSLRRLGVDAIDLLQHHWPDPAVPIEETFSAVDKLLRDGKIRAAGVSNYNVEQMEAARKVVPLASNQPPYSMVRRDIERDSLPWCRANGVSVIVYSPMQLGLLTGKVTEDREFPDTDTRHGDRFFTRENRRRVNAFLQKIKPIADAHGATLAQLVINWTLRQPGITVALVGARNAVQARENAGATAFKLSDDEMKKIDAELAALKLER